MERCDWSDLPRAMCACANCEGTPWPGDLDAPAPTPKPRLVTVWTPADDKATTPRDWNDGERPPKPASPCRYVEGWGYYLREHTPVCRDRACEGCKECTHDAHGNPVTHCTARQRCTEHLDATHPLTCPRCIARVRANLAHVERLSTLMLEQAIIAGIDSTATYLAGPVADPARVDAIRFYVSGHATHARAIGRLTGDKYDRILAELPTHDDRHPLAVLWKWEERMRVAYGHPVPRFDDPEHPQYGREKPVTITSAASYLSWLLTDMAQDPDRDFATFATEVKRCKDFLEMVLGASRLPEEGAPCPACADPKPRLARRRAHWCDDPECTREHDTTGARDTWNCPKNPEHWWWEANYRKATYEDAVAEGLKPRRARKGA